MPRAATNISRLPIWQRRGAEPVSMSCGEGHKATSICYNVNVMTMDMTLKFVVPRHAIPEMRDSSGPPGQERETAFHGLRCARRSPGCASPVATFRRPVGAEQRAPYENSMTF